jgi:hypothetical protein
MMTRRACLTILAAAVCAGALGAAGWVDAQQGAEPAAPPVVITPPPAPVAHSPPPADTAPPAAAAPTDAASADTADADTDEADSSESAEPAAAKPAVPMTRPRYAVAVLQAMDKVTAETMRFEAPVGQPIRYKSLIFIVRACETTAPDETISDAAAHVEIDSEPVAAQGAVAAPARQLFRGWMFANSPGLNLFENPAYDAWMIACKTASPAA